MRGSTVAPKLSLLEMKAQSRPSSSSASSIPEAASDTYTSPWPGGHHSSWGRCGHATGAWVSRVELGLARLQEVADVRERGAGRVARRERVHQDEREAGVLDLPGDDVEERRGRA